MNDVQTGPASPKWTLGDLALRHTSAKEAVSRITELEATIAQKDERIEALENAAQALVGNVRRGIPIDITATENQLALADALAALLPQQESSDGT